LSKAIAVCGHICSGKSSVVGYLARKYGWNVISFGKYIRHLAATRGLLPSRDVYQILGQEVFDERGGHQFLRDVMQFNQPVSFVHLFDGVRHIPMIEAIRQIYSDTFVIYLNVNAYERYRRFKRRAAKGDPSLTYEEFERLSDQPVEQGISEILNIADFSIDASTSHRKVVTEIEKTLINNGFIR
jgi:dephospho-CoA kinase